MSKYENTVAISREEDHSYRTRHVDCSPVRTGSGGTSYTTYTTQVVPSGDRLSSRLRELANRSGNYSSDDESYEQWTTSKRKVNHTTRQVETRVSRQLLVEDGKVIADSGPQVTTRIKEDNKVEESEKEKAPKNKDKFDAIEAAPTSDGKFGTLGGRVLGEKKEIQRVSREVREENMQYHDERFKELTGHDVHRKAIQAPHELITINDDHHSASSKPQGKMVHYSNKGKKYQDTDEILEVAKLAPDGSVTKEVKRTKHHEEFSEDELPDEKGEAEALRRKPIVTKSSRKHVDTVNDFNDFSTPSVSSDDEIQGDHEALRKHRNKSPSSVRRQHGTTSRHDDESAFPRYEIDPLLSSLRDDNIKPSSEYGARQHPVRERYDDHSHDSSNSESHRSRHRVTKHRSSRN